MFKSRVVAPLIVLLMVSSSAMAQNHRKATNGSLTTLEEGLQRHNIELTVPALIEALRNPSGEVRNLAANKLAQDGTREALPSIKEALNVEKVPNVRVNIAFALARLGDEKGFAALQQTCDNDGDSALNMIAARYMLDLQNEGCLKAVIHRLSPQSNDGSRMQALSLLPRFHQVPESDLREIHDLTIKSLAADTPAVRLAAGSVLVEMGDMSAIPYLQTAIANEQDESVRSGLQENLRRLEEKKSQQ